MWQIKKNSYFLTGAKSNASRQRDCVLTNCQPSQFQKLLNFGSLRLFQRVLEPKYKRGIKNLLPPSARLFHPCRNRISSITAKKDPWRGHLEYIGFQGLFFKKCKQRNIALKYCLEFLFFQYLYIIFQLTFLLFVLYEALFILIQTDKIQM